jgi:alpha-galactosidase
MQFVYSGGFMAEAEYDQYNQTRIQMGLSDEKLSYPLLSGESFIVPEVIMTFSDSGFEKISHNLHRCIRNHICRGAHRDLTRPILINSWEASYFDFTGDSFFSLAKQAKELDLDLIVMDDGWFGNRFDDNRALGDWIVNEEKLGCTLNELVQKVNGIGLKFGIWIEPEMVNEDSDLFRLHPDWALAIPNKKQVLGRNQLVLDFSRKDVQNYLFEAICNILDQANIEYLKWDYNRSISDVYSYATSDQGKVLYDYVIGLYDLLDKINKRYPKLLIEGCSGGGGRFDAGMLYYTPQIWCSDNTDAIDRLSIQYGTSFAYPACTVGSHVSACPNHQTGRITPLSTRGVVASSGILGYELDLNKLTELEKEEVRKQIKDYRNDYDLITDGLYYRLTDLDSQDFCAWEYLSQDGKKAIVSVVITQVHGNMPNQYVKPRGFTPDVNYKNVETGKIYPSNALMEFGFPLPQQFGEYNSYVYHFERL